MAKLGNRVCDVIERVDAALCADDAFTPVKGLLFVAGLLGATGLLAVFVAQVTG